MILLRKPIERYKSYHENNIETINSQKKDFILTGLIGRIESACSTSANSYRNSYFNSVAWSFGPSGEGSTTFEKTVKCYKDNKKTLTQKDLESYVDDVKVKNISWCINE